jgi:hypothetical protein
MMSQLLSIIKGTDRTIRVLLKTANGAPFSLENASAIKAIFLGSSDQLVELTLAASKVSVVGDAARGEIEITMEPEDTEDLQAGERLSWEVEITRSSKTYVVQFPEVLDVRQRLSQG